MTERSAASDPGNEAMLRVTGSVRIPRSEVELRFSSSGGPGGQHANKTATRVEARFDVEGSPSLGPATRQRLLARLGPVVRVVADDERSQLRNRAIALERLTDRLAEALRVEKPRRPTRPGRGAKERRLSAKRQRSDIKRSRQVRGDD